MWKHTGGSILLAITAFFWVLDSIGRYHDAKWLGKQLGSMSSLLAEQPAAVLYTALATLALIGLSLHVPSKTWAALWAHLHLGLPPEFTEILPGASFTILTKLSTQGVMRRKYLFSYPAGGGGEVSLYITADNRLIFVAKDNYGEEHTVNVPLDPKFIKYNQWTTVYAALGIAPNYSVMSLWLDGNCIKAQRFEFPIRIQNVAFNKGNIGASARQNGHGRFGLSQFCAIERTLCKKEIGQMTQFYEDKKPEKSLTLWKRVLHSLRSIFAKEKQP